MSNSNSYDVAVIGGGMSGASAAFGLGNAGLNVALIDRHPHYPNLFRAEKVEPEQADLLRELNLFDAVRPVLAPIKSITVGKAGRHLETIRIEQYGMSYPDLVNAARAALPPRVELIVARVSSITPSAQLSRIQTTDGKEITARLLLLANGSGGKFHEQLGIKKHMVSEDHSVTAGFNVAPIGHDFEFDSLTNHVHSASNGVDFITFFPQPSNWRVNVFAYWSARDPVVRALADAPVETLRRLAPRLERFTGKFEVTSKVESVPIDLYYWEAPARAGLVLLGDAFQSICPATGTGLGKLLMDAVTIVRLAPEWLNSKAITEDMVATYYADPRKQAVDSHSLSAALYMRNFVMDRSLRWRVHRGKTLVQQRIRRLTRR